ACAEGEVAQQQRLRERGGVAEVAEGRGAAFGGGDPFLVVVFRTGERPRRGLVAFELLLGQEQEPVGLGFAAAPGPREHRALGADDQRPVGDVAVVGAEEQVVRWLFAAVVERQLQLWLLLLRGERHPQNAPG